MKRRYVNRLIACTLAATMVCGLAACGSTEQNEVSGTGSVSADSEASAEDGDAQETKTEEEGEVVRITMYPPNASATSGVLGGYLGEYMATRGLEVETWAYSEDKTNAILASGDLPDVMYVTAEQLEVMIDSDMVLQLDDYLDDIPHIAEEKELLDPAFSYIREFRSNGTGKVYAFPTGVGPSASGGQTDRNRVSVYWDAYKAAGYPEINSFDDLIPAMKQMMEAYPEDENGIKMWGCQMNAGSDGVAFGNLTLWYKWQGYQDDQLAYLLETDMVNGTYSSILSKDSLYYAGLKFYNQANREGVFDPDSINIDRTTQGAKPRAIGSGTNPGWHDDYYEVFIPGTTIYYRPYSTYGSTNTYLVINKNTDELDACLRFVDFLADSAAQIWANMGPEGDYWYVTEDNHLLLTDKAKEFLEKSDGSKYVYDATGEEAYLWNIPFIMGTGVETGYLGFDESPIVNRHSDWAEEMQYTTDTENYNDWKKHNGGYATWQELLLDKNAWVSESPLDDVASFTSTPDDMMKLTIDAIKDVVVNASWEMVYAESDEQFDAIWDQMIKDCEGLEAQNIIDWRLEDLENAKAIRDSLEN